MFSWADNTNQNPYYAIYDVKTSTFTTPPTQIDSVGYTKGVWSDVFCCYNSINNQVVFSWDDGWDDGDRSSYNAWYAIYDVKTSSFTTLPTLIDLSYTAQVWDGVFCCYNSANNQVIFSWASWEGGDYGNWNPYYAIYDVKTSSFTTPPTQIDSAGYTQQVKGNVFCCYNSVNNQVVFSLAGKIANRNPYYAIYDVKTSTFTTLPTLIDLAYTAGVIEDVFCCYNNANNQVVFSWADATADRNPYYAIYDVKTSTFTTLPTLIDSGYTTGAIKDLFCCYNSVNNQVVFSWADKTVNQNPYYAIYDVKTGAFTTLPTLFSQNYSNGAIGLGVFCSYNKVSNQFIFSWSSSFIGRNPWYAIYVEPFPPHPKRQTIDQAMRKFSPVIWQKGKS